MENSILITFNSVQFKIQFGHTIGRHLLRSIMQKPHIWVPCVRRAKCNSIIRFRLVASCQDKIEFVQVLCYNVVKRYQRRTSISFRQLSIAFYLLPLFHLSAITHASRWNFIRQQKLLLLFRLKITRRTKGSRAITEEKLFPILI